MASQLAERFGITNCFSDPREMLQSIHPAIVHITTPPQSHYSLAMEALEAGTNVYLEKPFTVTASEAESLVRIAETRNLKITAGHNYQFTLEMLEMRRLAKEGFLGGKPVHLESYWSYDLGDTNYASAFLSNRTHWLRQLPGQLFHNIISHGLAKLAEFLDDELTEIVAVAGQSPFIAQFGADDVLDELRVLIRDKTGTTALFCFSTQLKRVNQLRVYGPATSMTADIVAGTLIRIRNKSYKSYLTYVIPSVTLAGEYIRNAGLNVINFLRRRLYQDFGMKELVARFYDSVRSDASLPIPYREILLTARIMDEVFAQIYPDRGRPMESREQRTEDRQTKATVHSPVPS